MSITNKQKMVKLVKKYRNIMKGEMVGSDMWNFCKFAIEHQHKEFRKRKLTKLF